LIAPEGYTLEKVIAEDTTGLLVAATQVRLRRAVTLKILKREYAKNTRALELFRAERDVVAGLEHPHLLLTLDLGETGGRPWFVTESISETTVQEALTQPTKLGELRAVRIALGIAQAVHYLSSRGLIYKNVCPKNILLPRPAAAKLVTFRHVRRMEEAQSFQGAHTQSGLYCAPELTRDDMGAVSTKSNVYAVGAILYELLAGEPVCEGNSAEARTAHAEGTIPPLKETRGFLRDRAYAVVSRLLKHDPRQRVDSAAAVALLEAYSNDPLVAAPLRPGKKKRRRRR
jgi:serine/threonine protein kinase